MKVTPCMGVWIETNCTGMITLVAQSHPVWVCGLKLRNIECLCIEQRHTLYGCVD